MTHALRLVAFGLVVALAVTGPLAPLASAQQPSAPPAPPAERANMQPDIYRDQIREEARQDVAAYDAGAGFANLFYFPGKIILCTLGTAAGAVAMAATFGSGYKAAAEIAREGCGGKWALTGEDLRSDRLK